MGNLIFKKKNTTNLFNQGYFLIVVLLLFVPGQVREVDALPRLVLDELDVFAAVGAGWVVAPPFGHALQAELVAAG